MQTLNYLYVANCVITDGVISWCWIVKADADDTKIILLLLLLLHESSMYDIHLGRNKIISILSFIVCLYAFTL